MPHVSQGPRLQNGAPCVVNPTFGRHAVRVRLFRHEVPLGTGAVVHGHPPDLRAPGHYQQGVQCCRQDGTEDEVDVEPGDALGRNDGGEDAASGDEVGQVHQEDGHGTFSFLRDQDLVIQPSYRALAELADREAGTNRTHHTVQGTDNEATHDYLETSVVVVWYLSEDQQDNQNYLQKIGVVTLS